MPSFAFAESSRIAEHDSFWSAAPVPAAQFSFENSDDLDFDSQPDDWTRRTGSGFPQFIGMEIDRQVGVDGNQSLRVDVEAGKAAYYSKPIRISPHHSYVFSGQIRTFGLKNDAALVSLSFLDARKDRVHRFLTAPVSGTSENWNELRIGPIMPNDDVRFVVIGCHLVNNVEMDYQGNVWFDALSLRMLPRLTIETNFDELLKAKGNPFEVDTVVSGLGDDGDYELKLSLENANFRSLEKVTYKFDRQQRPGNSGSDQQPTTHALPSAAAHTTGSSLDDSPIVNQWSIDPPGIGFYRLHATLRRDSEVILDRSTSVVFPARVKETSSTAPRQFGWSIERMPATANPDHLVAAASAAGIGWIKMPLWQTVSATDINGERATQTANLLQELKRNDITTIGILDEPPHEMRRKFADDWNGVAEVFSMPPAFWMPSLEPVMARYSSLVRHWQLGGESDTSFSAIQDITPMLSNLKGQFDRLGRDTVLGTHWTWNRTLPQRGDTARAFLSLSSDPALDANELSNVLTRSDASGFFRWVLLRPQPVTLSTSRSEVTRDLDQRVTELLKRIVAARIGNADVVFAADVFDPRIGLLNQDASPSELFLPWRTWTRALDQSTYLGSLRLPSGSTNHVFIKGDEAIVCLWNDELVTEEIALGQDVEAFDVWGKKQEVTFENGTKFVPVGTLPVLLRSGSSQLAQFRLSAKFEQGRMPSSTDEFTDHLVITNPFSQGISGECTISPPREWEVRPRELEFSLKRGETTRIPVIIRLPGHQSLGLAPVQLDFKIEGKSVDFISITRDQTIGLGDITIDIETEMLDNGLQEIRQKMENNTDESMSFRVSLYVPGQKRQRRRVSNLDPGENNTISYRVAGIDALKGRTLRIRAEQMGGSRVLNKSWIVE